MRSTRAVLLILDISGYTRFIHQRAVSLEHAEGIITELIEAVIDEADLPLKVNKLEGDAALLFAECAPDPALQLRQTFLQLGRFFAAFSQRLEHIRRKRGHCGCDACANVEQLQLKALLHQGPIVIKQVRQFEEIAGDAVILLHRLLKNDVPASQYLLLTADARQPLGDLCAGFERLEQAIEGMPPCAVYWTPSLPQAPDGLRDRSATPQVALVTQGALRSHTFHHLPRPWWHRLGERVKHLLPR
jgi:hypothetical protein